MGGGKMGKKEGTYFKTMKGIYDRRKKLEEKIEELNEELRGVIKKERQFWVKTGICSICLCDDQPTEWHHIISQHRCRELGKEYLIHSRTNVVEVCKPCHDETTASLRRKAIDITGGNKSVKNPGGPITQRQIDYIKKLSEERNVRVDIEQLRELTRGDASQRIDELKEMKT
jgi:hypothetical protein